jgi:thiamine-phosphate pyrophosphorylase
MRGLYAIVDVESLERRSLDPVRFAAAVLDARPAALQVRDKLGGARRTLELLRAIAPLARAAGVPLFANDRPDLALLAGCEGVHVGQDDLPVALVRGLAVDTGGAGRAGLRIGLSTHDEAQLDAALAMDQGPDYLAVGPVFATSSKDRPSPVVGVARLAALARRVRAARPGTPVVAIGGITLARAAEVGAAADVGAVIAALLPEGSGDTAYAEVTERARALHAALSATPAHPRAHGAVEAAR